MEGEGTGKYAQLLSEKKKQKEKIMKPHLLYIDKVEQNLFNLLAD